MLINKALKFAALAHRGMERKITLLPYIIHPVGVMNIIKYYHPTAKSETLMAALLHDVIEDTVHTGEEIREIFGDTVGELVEGMTKKDYPGDIRAVKNHKRAVDNSNKSDVVQYIKLADMLHNLEDIVEFDKKYGIMFLREKALFLELSSPTVKSTKLAEALRLRIREGLAQFHMEDL